MNIDKSLILNELKKHYNFKKEVDFASFLGIKPQTLASWHSRNVFDIEILYEKCNDISPDFLFTGKGDVKRLSSDREPENPYSKKIVELQEYKIENLEKELKKCKSEKKILQNNRAVVL